MFKMLKRSCCFFAIAAIGFSSFGCGGCKKLDKFDSNCIVTPTVYENIASVDKLDKYAADVATNLPVKNGIINSPYYSMQINSKNIPIYATRSANGIHSFAYIDIQQKDIAKDFSLDVTINILEPSSVLDEKKPTIVVLPESSGIAATIKGETVNSIIKKTGSFSFVFNKDHKEALTLFVAQKQSDKDIIPSGYDVQEIEPSELTSIQTGFSKTNTVYKFKAGRYKIDCIALPSDCVLFLERGAYLEVMPNENGSKSAITALNAKNIKVTGRGLLDFSACCGGEVPDGYYNNKTGIVFNQVDEVVFEGITVINSQTWTLCFNDCENVLVKNCLMFGYRVYADGVMLSDCKNAIVEDCFVRTGDDAFETKSTTATGETDNVLFRNNAAWTDKAVAYGCIYESNHDTKNVTFSNCSVGFSLGTWSNHLGCCVVQMGDRKGAKMHDIHFNDIEIYTTHNAICNIYIGGSGGQGAGYGTVSDIYFKNITAKRNYSYFLNLRTYDNENCFIKDLYLDNIVSNDVQLTLENVRKNVKIAATFNLDNLHINSML